MIYTQRVLNDDDIQGICRVSNLKVGPVRFRITKVEDVIFGGIPAINLALRGWQPDGATGLYYEAIFLNEESEWKKVLVFNCVGCIELLKLDKFDSQWLLNKEGDAVLTEKRYTTKEGEEKIRLVNDHKKLMPAAHQLTLDEIKGITEHKTMAQELGVELDDELNF